MMSLFRRDRDGELELLRSAVSQLGETSVEGLSRALAWRRRTTERCLVEELRRPSTPLVYDPARGTIRWGPAPVPSVEPGLPAVEGTSWGPPGPPLEPPPSAPPAPLAPPGAEVPPIRGTCPSCHVPLHPATNGAFAVCPRCGKLRSRRTLEASQGPPPGPAERTPDGEAASPPGDDRRAQEMLAAYVTSRPILCPRCHAPLRHRSLAEYVCPTCGREVRFPSNPGIGASPSVPAEPAPASRSEGPRTAPPPSTGTRPARGGSRAHAGETAPEAPDRTHSLSPRTTDAGQPPPRRPAPGRRGSAGEPRGRVACSNRPRVRV